MARKRVILKVWGDNACFTRPEMKVERVSYDVMTPSAARGIIEAIHWKPAIRYVIERIHVLNPIQFENIRRNEVGSKLATTSISKAQKTGNLAEAVTFIDEDRQQRAATVLRQVVYVIEASFEMTKQAGADDNLNKHFETFKRRAQKGQCFQQPCLGNREFPAYFEWIDQVADIPKSSLPELDRNKDLGYMLWDIDYKNKHQARFFRARLEDGVLNVPPFGETLQ
ncbi:type I-C CRISPR-associated protein Cas5 [Alkanindiges illinoisensis]|uniref:pre-crRNA processing endonuclease n=2 Tax=Alkanindiges illinoisensis TaxID=197183 RepID=A0A4Y7XEP6_9GAMM|nr:type I-C CRISPR-associated protein Cas5 [Alkanindiges illinoisensis]